MDTWDVISQLGSWALKTSLVQIDMCHKCRTHAKIQRLKKKIISQKIFMLITYWNADIMDILG